MNYIPQRFPKPTRVSQAQPQPEAERRHAVPEEFPVRRGPAVAFQEQAPPPPGSRHDERVGQLEPGDEAPADLPAAVLHRSAVQRRHQPPRGEPAEPHQRPGLAVDRKSTRLNSSHMSISYAVFCLKKKKN